MDGLLFFDIDGTLAYPKQAPSSATVTAIRKPYAWNATEDLIQKRKKAHWN